MKGWKERQGEIEEGWNGRREMEGDRKYINQSKKQRLEEKKMGRSFSTEGKFYLYKKYFMAVLLENKIRVPSLKYYSAYRGKSVTTQSFISFLPETVPDGAM